MTALLLMFLDGITEAERSKVTCLSSSETQERKCPMSVGSQHTILLATQPLFMAAIMDFLILMFEILGSQ